MPPKSAMEWIAEMLAQQVQLNKELAQAQEDVAREERQRPEEAAAKEKKEREKCDAACKLKEAAKEKRELKVARAQVARYEAEAKARAEVGELIGGSNVSLDTEVRITGVTTKVSDSVVVANFSELGK